MTEAITPSASVRPQLERAREENAGRWYKAALVMLVLLVTGIGAPLIPIVAIYTLVATLRNERDARAGVYDNAPQANINETTLSYWIGAVALVGVGVMCAVFAVAATKPVGMVVASGLALLLIGAGLALRPWRRSWAPLPRN